MMGLGSRIVLRTQRSVGVGMPPAPGQRLSDGAHRAHAADGWCGCRLAQVTCDADGPVHITSATTTVPATIADHHPAA